MNHFIFTLTAVYFIISSSLKGQEFQLELSQVLTIGEKSSNSPEYLFSGIRTIRLIPPNNNILVADASNASIRTYDKNGRFVKQIGQRGRGPGDFQEVTSVTVNEDGTFIVTDRRQERISFYDIEGNYLHSQTLDGKSLGTLQFVYKKKSDNTYFIAFRNYLKAETDGHFLHLMDSTLTDKKLDFIDLYEFFYDPLIPFERQISLSPRYLYSETGINTIAIVPHTFFGTVLLFNKETFTTEIIGEKVEEPYVLYDFDIGNKLLESGEPGFASSSGQNGIFVFKRKGISFALVGNKNFLLHFYGLFGDDKIIPFLNIYTSSGEKLTSLSLDNSSIIQFPNNTFSFRPHFLDDDNNLYVGDYYYEGSYPAVRVFQTNLNEFIND